MLPSDPARFAICLLLALAQNAENLGLLLGLHWYCTFVLALLLVMEFPASRSGRWAYVLVTTLIIWSSPATLALLPFFLVCAVRTENPARRKACLLAISNLLVVVVFLIILRLEMPERVAGFSPEAVLAAAHRLVLRGWIGTGLLGRTVSGWLALHAPLLLDFAALAVLAAVAAAVFRRRRTNGGRRAAVLLCAALCIIAVSLTRTLYLEELRTLVIPRHDRYLTAPTLLLLVALAILVHPVMNRWRRSAIIGAWAALAALQASGIPAQVHWSRSAQHFPLERYVDDIHVFKNKYRLTGVPASLYIPHDVPYDGPVLRLGGGEAHSPETGLAAAIGATPVPVHADAASRHPPPAARRTHHSWLGRFREAPDSAWIEHERWGRLEFLGVWGGRVWFRDDDERLWFTSTLLYPRIWVFDGERFILR